MYHHFFIYLLFFSLISFSNSAVSFFFEEKIWHEYSKSEKEDFIKNGFLNLIGSGYEKESLAYIEGGSGGAVFKCRYSDGCWHAIKMHFPKKYSNGDLVRDELGNIYTPREVRFLKWTSGFVKERGGLHIHYDSMKVHDIWFHTMPFYPCSLRDLLNKAKERNKKIKVSLVIKIIVEVLKNLEFLHSHDFIHRDIKPDNILLSMPCEKILNNMDLPVRAILADFGSIKPCGSKSQSGNPLGISAKYTPDMVTFGYRGPELCSEPAQQTYTKSIDIWSIGIVGWETLIGENKIWAHSSILWELFYQEPSLERNLLFESINYCLGSKLRCKDIFFSGLEFIYSGLWNSVGELYDLRNMSNNDPMLGLLQILSDMLGMDPYDRKGVDEYLIAFNSLDIAMERQRQEKMAHQLPTISILLNWVVQNIPDFAICDICQKKCKNKHGLSIHRSAVHFKKTNAKDTLLFPRGNGKHAPRYPAGFQH